MELPVQPQLLTVTLGHSLKSRRSSCSCSRHSPSSGSGFLLDCRTSRVMYYSNYFYRLFGLLRDRRHELSYLSAR